MQLIIDRQIEYRFYPNLARHEAYPRHESWQKFSVTWPYSEPLSLIDYLRNACLGYEVQTVDRSTKNSYYPIAVSFFDFGIQWFDLLSPEALAKLRSKNMRLLFWYSEGDNPSKIQQHLFNQARHAGVDEDCIWLVSANTQANNLKNCVYFADDELLYRQRNMDVPATIIHDKPRGHKCTALVRTHKWWRAAAMTDIWRSGLHQGSFFSYNNSITTDDRLQDNPIEIDCFPGLRSSMYKFLDNCPFLADDLTSNEHNNHCLHVDRHYSDSYFNLIIETHMDADQSGGAFLTEKTFKPLKHGQPFIVLGCVGTLETIRKLGYQLPLGIDNTYDSIKNTTQRYQAAMSEIKRILSMDLSSLHNLYLENLEILHHNQRLFLENKNNRLNSLIERLTCQK